MRQEGREGWATKRKGRRGYNQHNQESHGGLPHRQTPFVPHVLRYAPSKVIEKP